MAIKKTSNGDLLLFTGLIVCNKVPRLRSIPENLIDFCIKSNVDVFSSKNTVLHGLFEARISSRRTSMVTDLQIFAR